MAKIAVGPWFRGIPPELEIAVNHVRAKFCDTLEQYSDPTAELCAATLHKSPFIPTDKWLADLLHQLKQTLPTSQVRAFDYKLEVGTPGAIIAAYFGLLVAVAEQALGAAFYDYFEIAEGFGSRLQASSLAWTQIQVGHLSSDTAPIVTSRWLIKACIDRNNYKLGDEYPDKWRAPRYISLAGATGGEFLVRDYWNRPIDPWKRGSAKQTEEWVKTVEWHWNYRLASRLQHLIGDLAVNVAKQGGFVQLDSTPLETDRTQKELTGVVATELADDHRSVRIGCEEYQLTKNQGAMMKVLIEAREKGTGFAVRRELCAAIKSPLSSPRDSWKKSVLWRKGIVRGSRERYWLDLSLFERTGSVN